MKDDKHAMTLQCQDCGAMLGTFKESANPEKKHGQIEHLYQTLSKNLSTLEGLILAANAPELDIPKKPLKEAGKIHQRVQAEVTKLDNLKANGWCHVKAWIDKAKDMKSELNGTVAKLQSYIDDANAERWKGLAL